LLPEVALPLTAAEEDELEALGLEAELDATRLVPDCEVAPPVMVVPAAVMVVPAIVRVTGSVQGQSVMTVGPGMTVVTP